jgi:hypothetical protein
MEHQSIISAIDAEIAKLQKVRKLLATIGIAEDRVAQRSAKRTQKAKKRVLSPEARKRIADAQRRRWAAQKKGAK